MKALIAVAVISVSLNAYATASPQGCASSKGQAAGCTTTTVSPTITPTIAPVISPTMSPSATATGEGGQGGNANATGGNATGGNATGGNSNVNVTLQGGSNPSSSIKTVGVAPDILSTPTAACRISVGASAGWLGGALGFGTSVLDEGCHIREVSRHLSNLGLREAAVLAMCQDTYARKAMGTLCPEEQ